MEIKIIIIRQNGLTFVYCDIFILFNRKMTYFMTLQYRKMESFISLYEHDLIQSL